MNKDADKMEDKQMKKSMLRKLSSAVIGSIENFFYR
jgi:hypothetical protein